jgi:hypothetical protein
MFNLSRFSACICALSFALSACSSTTPASPPGPAKTTLSIATQRNAAQAALAAEFGVGILTLIFGQGTSQAFGGPNTLPVCNNGVKVSIVSGATTITTTIDVFYDPVCTTILAHVVLTQTQTSPTTSTLTGTATFTTSAGAVIAYNTLSGSVTKSGGTTSFSVTGTAAPSPSAPAIASFGLSCSVTGSANTCGFGGVQNLSFLNAEFGNTFSFNGTQTGNTNTGGATLKAYVSALNAMTLSPSGSTSWTITGGGNPLINDTGTFTVTVGAFNLATAIGISLSDVTSDVTATASMSSGPFGNTAGNVIQISNGAAASFYGVDGTGSGTILFSDGSTAPVGGFIIQ